MKRYKSITKPGYHIKAKWDLPGLRKRRTHEGHKSADTGLPLVSMIDMFTILVIFLLMNFSATGEIFFMPKELRLPEAFHSEPLQGAPLITVTEKEVIFEVEKVGDNPLTLTESNSELPKLAQALQSLKVQMIIERPQNQVAFQGNINIQADENTPLIYVKRVMQTCILNGWNQIHFAVRTP